MKPSRLGEMQSMLCQALDRGSEARTIDESLAQAVVKMDARGLLELARRAHHRRSREMLALIQAEFLRRRGVQVSAAA